MILKQTPSPEKIEESRKLKNDVDRFLKEGGKIEVIDKGVSENEKNYRWDAGKIKQKS